MKGFMKDDKFHPIKPYQKGVRKSRDQSAKTQGVRLKREDGGTSMKEFIDSGNYLEGEVRRRAEKGSPHFFDKDTMRFFSSRISELMWKDHNRNIWFITSEADRGHIKHTGSARAFTVRKIDENGDIKTAGEFQGHSTLSEARRAIKDVINKGING